MIGALSPVAAARRRRILRIARRPVTPAELERLARSQCEPGSRDVATRGLKVRAAVRSLVKAGCLTRTGPGLRTTDAGEAHYAELAGL